MIVRVLNADGAVSDIHNVNWHPAYSRDCGKEGIKYFPAGLWIRLSDVVNHYRRINDTRKRFGITYLRNLDRVVDDIECAEADLEIYDDETYTEPWLHNDVHVWKIQYGKDEDWWNNHT